MTESAHLPTLLPIWPFRRSRRYNHPIDGDRYDVCQRNAFVSGRRRNATLSDVEWMVAVGCGDEFQNPWRLRKPALFYSMEAVVLEFTCRPSFIVASVHCVESYERVYSVITK